MIQYKCTYHIYYTSRAKRSEKLNSCLFLPYHIYCCCPRLYIYTLNRPGTLLIPGVRMYQSQQHLE